MRYRSFFWPGVLILAGVIALLVNTGAITGDRVIQLLTLWPLILIVIGLEIIARRSIHGAASDVAAALIVLVAVAAAVGYVAIAPNPSATSTLDATGPKGELRQASLQVNVGSANVTMTSADLGSDLYHLHISYSGDKPDVRFEASSGALTIDQNNRSVFGLQRQRFVMTLELSSSVAWSVSENTGASNDTINLAQTTVTALKVNAGAAREDITLGPATGEVPVDINGGAVTAYVHRPSGTRASIEVSGGAVSLDADGHSYHSIGRVAYTQGNGGDFYRIRVSGGACTVTLDTTAGSD
ncbi:MAG TPA: DUF5668 domain-containing protein [Candidatus Limnocylindrales bacterium]|nr:DUF5668 domain-containing protein [Candidatus Limnocylindrales bacterium]